MKKFVLSFVICIPLCLIIGFTAGMALQYVISNDVQQSRINDVDEEEQYFRKINDIIKDLEFHSAKTKDGKIVLYNENYEPISEIPFNDYDKSIKFIYARKNGSIVYFIQQGAVDDEWGIMFVNDDSDGMMSGIWHADRISGNAYKYSTMK